MALVRKKTIIPILLCLISVFFVHDGCPVSANDKVNGPSLAENEILVAKDIGGGLPFSRTFSLSGWCGNTSILIHGTETGIELIDLDGNKTSVSTNGTDYPRGCTPDGKWVIYEDRKSAREYRDRFGRVPENIVDDGPGWHGFIIDLYRYEVATGTRQKFAVVRDDSTASVSPDGLKVLLGNRHDSAIEMPEPKWKALWLTNEWTYLETFWFPDSSGIATLLWGNGASLGVEFFGQKRWAKEFSLDSISPARKFSGSIEAMDNEGRLYFSTTVYTDGGQGKNIYDYFRCDIKDKELVCEAIGELDGREHRIGSREILPNGNIVFKRDGEYCIRLMEKGQTGSECVADIRHAGAIYENIDLIETSADGKWMAFRRSKLPPPAEKRFYAYQYDLFVKELSRE